MRHGWRNCWQTDYEEWERLETVGCRHTLCVVQYSTYMWQYIQRRAPPFGKKGSILRWRHCIAKSKRQSGKAHCSRFFRSIDWLRFLSSCALAPKCCVLSWVNPNRIELNWIELHHCPWSLPFNRWPLDLFLVDDTPLLCFTIRIIANGRIWISRSWRSSPPSGPRSKGVACPFPLEQGLC